MLAYGPHHLSGLKKIKLPETQILLGKISFLVTWNFFDRIDDVAQYDQYVIKKIAQKISDREAAIEIRIADHF